MSLTFIILLSGGLITLMAYANELPDQPGLRRLLRSFWFKVITTSILLIIMGIATIWKDKIAEQEQADERKIQAKRDSINEIKNEKDKLKIIETFSEGFAKYSLKVDNLLPVISDIKINSVSDGIILSYQLNKQVEKLELELGPNPYDKAYDYTYGAGSLELPTRIGANTYKINFKKLGLGSKVTLLIKSENPYHSLPLIEHYHSINNTTDVIITTEDGRTLTTEDGKTLVADRKK